MSAPARANEACADSKVVGDVRRSWEDHKGVESLKAQPCSSASVVPRPPSKRWIGGKDSEGNGMVMAILGARSVTGQEDGT